MKDTKVQGRIARQMELFARLNLGKELWFILDQMVSPYVESLDFLYLALKSYAKQPIFIV